MSETREQRSRIMRAVRSYDTGPELAVRRALRNMGYSGYRIHRKELPGRPDIAFLGQRKAIFVHGCFWHGHSCRRGVRRPMNNERYWAAKIKANKARDKCAVDGLLSLGWSVLTVWECELHPEGNMAATILAFMAAK